MFNFCWDNLTEDNFKKFYEVFIHTDDDLIDDCVGQVRAGVICIDLIIRTDNEKMWLSYDVYVGYCDSGYGYKNNIPYDYKDGGDFKNADVITNHEYADFKEMMKKEFTDFIMKNNLINEANQTLIKW